MKDGSIISKMDSPNIFWFRDVVQGNIEEDDNDKLKFIHCSFHKAPWYITHYYYNRPDVRDLELGPTQPNMESVFDITDN